MRVGCLRCARPRSGRTLVGSGPRDWSRRFAAALVLESIDRHRLEIGLEPAVVAAFWLLAGRGVPVGNSNYASAFPDADRIAEILGAAGFVFSLCAVLQNSDPLAQLCVVLVEPRICRFLVCHPAAFYL